MRKHFLKTFFTARFVRFGLVVFGNACGVFQASSAIAFSDVKCVPARDAAKGGFAIVNALEIFPNENPGEKGEIVYRFASSGGKEIARCAETTKQGLLRCRQSSDLGRPLDKINLKVQIAPPFQNKDIFEMYHPFRLHLEQTNDEKTNVDLLCLA